MNFTNLLFFFLSYMLISIGHSTSQKCYDTGNFIANSIYGRNRNQILSSLASNATEGFYNATIGQDSDEVYALAHCSGESSAEECSNCVNLTSKEIMTKCPNQKEAFMWGWQLTGRAPCYVHYSNHSFFGVLEQFTPEILYNMGDITSDLMTEFNQIWEELMDGLVRKASISRLMFATAEANLTQFQTIYALMQCTPDLSQSNCSLCLRQYVAEYQKCCNGKQGGVVQGPNCISRWDLYPFHKITATPTITTTKEQQLVITLTDRCINSTSKDIMTESPNQKEASCIVHYADRSFSGKLELDPIQTVYTVGNLRMDMTESDKFWKGLMVDILQKNASIDYTRFTFATGDVNPTVFQTRYALMRCAPYLSQIDCNSCLRQNMAKYPICCHGSC